MQRTLITEGIRFLVWQMPAAIFLLIGAVVWDGEWRVETIILSLFAASSFIEGCHRWAKGVYYGIQCSSTGEEQESAEGDDGFSC